MREIPFSERMGFTNPPEIQINSMNERLSNAIWNLIEERFLLQNNELNESNLKRAFCAFYGRRWNEIRSAHKYSSVEIVQDLFDNSSWDQKYGLIESLFKLYKTSDYYKIVEWKNAIRLEINYILEKEGSGYRLFEYELVPISHTNELSAISSAIDSTKSSKLKGARHHIELALEAFAIKPTPNLEDTIQQSLKAVETTIRALAEITDATPKLAIKELENKIAIDPMIKSIWLGQIGYLSSNEGGIRHGKIDGQKITFEYAKFILVNCSSLINYFVARASKS